MSIRITDKGLEIFEIDDKGNIINKGSVEQALFDLQGAQKEIIKMHNNIQKKVEWSLFFWIVGTLTAVIVVVPATLTQIRVNEIKEQTTILQNQDTKLKDQDTKLKEQDTKLKDQDKVILDLQLKINTLEEQIKHKD